MNPDPNPNANRNNPNNLLDTMILLDTTFGSCVQHNSSLFKLLSCTNSVS